MDFIVTLAAVFAAEPTSRPLLDLGDLEALPNGQRLYAHWDGDQGNWQAGYFQVRSLFVSTPLLVSHFLSYLAGYKGNPSRHNILAVSAFLHTGARSCPQGIQWLVKPAPLYHCRPPGSAERQRT